MPSDWLRIKQARPDLTDYLIHWTRGQRIGNKWVKPFEVLKIIVQCGVLKPSFAPRRRRTVGGVDNTIKGSRPAVCFTEQPLDAFIKSCHALSSRYRPYGIAVRKDRLFEYGGRPVVYGDESAFDALPEAYEYLWVRFQPIPNPDFGDYPLDWTHEREWRTTTRVYNYGKRGRSPVEGVPLLLPPDFNSSSKPRLHLPWILVKEKAEAQELRQWIVGLPTYAGTNGVMQLYFQVLPKMPIVPLDEVENRLKQGDTQWSRLDTLPYQELDPGAVKTFTRIGWKDLP